MNDCLLVTRKGAVLANESVMSNFSTTLKYLQNYVWFVGIGQKMTEQMMSLKAIESAEMILRNIEFKFSEDSKEKSSSVAYFPPIIFFKIITI